EVSNAGFRKTTDAEAAAIAEVDLVGVQLENLLLVETLFEFERDHRFGEFATPGSFVRKEKSTSDLHGDGAGTLIVLAGVADIGTSGTGDANEIEAAVIEEALVLSG